MNRTGIDNHFFFEPCPPELAKTFKTKHEKFFHFAAKVFSPERSNNKTPTETFCSFMYLLIPVPPFFGNIITYAWTGGKEFFSYLSVCIVTTSKHSNEQNHEKSKVVLSGFGFLFRFKSFLLLLQNVFIIFESFFSLKCVVQTLL